MTFTLARCPAPAFAVVLASTQLVPLPASGQNLPASAALTPTTRQVGGGYPVRAAPPPGAKVQADSYVAAVRSIILSKTTTVGGETLLATVNLLAAAPAGGLVVPLRAALAGSASLTALSPTSTRTVTSRTTITTTAPVRGTTAISDALAPATTNTLAATVPPSVTVPAGQMAASFPVEVRPVTADQRIVLTAGTAPNSASVTLTVTTSQPAYVALRVEGPDNVPEGGTASFRAIAQYADGSTIDVTPYAFSWSVDNGVGSTIRGGVLTVPPQLSQPTTAIVRAGWGEPDGATRGGYKMVNLRSWGVEIEGPSEVTESDLENHLQAGSAQYRMILIGTDGVRTQQTGGIWSYAPVSGLGANILPDGKFGVYAASSDLQAKIRVNYVHSGATRTAEKPVQIRRLASKLEGLRILNAPSDIPTGAAQQLTAQAQFRGGTSRTVTAAWSLNSAPAGTSIAPGTGLFTAGAVAGEAQIRATYTQDGITKTGSASISVRTGGGTITQLLILPPASNSQWPTSMFEGTTRQYKAQLGYADGRVEDVQPQWSVNSPAVQISSGGLLTTSDIAADVPVTVTARHTVGGQTFSRSEEVLVKPIALLSCRMFRDEIEVPTYATFPAASTIQLRLQIRWNNATTTYVTSGPEWSMTGGWSNVSREGPFATPPEVSISSSGLMTIPAIPPSSNDNPAISGQLKVQYAHDGKPCGSQTVYYSAR